MAWSHTSKATFTKSVKPDAPNRRSLERLMADSVATVVTWEHVVLDREVHELLVLCNEPDRGLWATFLEGLEMCQPLH